jgi:glycosyltransferase involved in cell wall biosynthesis
MSAEPLVSVVLPTYNRAHSLARAMSSVLAQTVRDLELIVVDDGSTDDTERVVAELAAADRRVRFVRRANGGPAAARNTGLRESRGEYVAFQDSDDEWLVGKLERQIAALRAAGPAIGLCVTGYFMHRDWTVYRVLYLGSYHLVHRDVRKQALENFYFPTPTWLARRDVLLAAGGFDESLRCWEDWELAIRIGRDKEILLLDEPLHLQHEGQGVNRQPMQHGRAMRRILEKHEALWANEPRLLAQHLYLIGRLECFFGSVVEARPFLRRAVQLNPWAWRARAMLLLSSLGDDGYRRVVGMTHTVRGWLRRLRQAYDSLMVPFRHRKVGASHASEDAPS